MSEINPSLGMRITLSGIRNLFVHVPQISTTKLHDMWLENRINLESKTSADASHQGEQSYLILIDVRERHEREISFIEGSMWLDSSDTSEENAQKVKELICNKSRNFTQCSAPASDLDQPHINASQAVINVVAYCSIGYRSSALISQVLQMNFLQDFVPSAKINVFNLEGSIFKWANEGKQLVMQNNQPTIFVHPYNAMWGKLLKENLRKSSL